jgi:transposase
MGSKLYCGVDLHSTNGVYHVMGADGQQVWHRRLPNRSDVVVTSLAAFLPDLVTVAIESTYNWYWLADCLEDAGHKVVLANPSRMDQYRGMKNTNDDSDATFIAELSRLGILPTGWICPRQERALRDLLRRRMLAVESRTAQVNSLQAMLVRQTGSFAKYTMIESCTTAELMELLTHESLLVVADAQLKLIGAHDAAIAALEQFALGKCRPRSEYPLLTSMPGVGKILSMTMMLEIGDIHRFARPGELSSYARAVKADRLSNGKVKGKNNGRNGNRYLAWAFIEAVNHAVRCCEPARQWYQRKAATTQPVVARKALASKFAKAVWYMLTENRPFQIQKIFG